MGNAGLLLVGVVLLVNGLVILSVVPPRSAALLNIFVGTAQVLLPTIILIQNADNPVVVNGTWPSYLFGITYLYYGLGIYLNLEPEGLGWFSAFVAAVVGYLAITTVSSDPVTAVMLGTWTVMWLLFFGLMALHRDGLARFTGWLLVLLGVPTCTIPGIAQLNGHWTTSAAAGWAALGAVAVAVVASALLAARPPAATAGEVGGESAYDEPVAVPQPA